jgi:hypothetical protein
MTTTASERTTGTRNGTTIELTIDADSVDDARPISGGSA